MAGAAKKIALFRCRPWRCDLTRGACAVRSRKARTERKHGESRSMIHCEKCMVGIAHARGKVPTHWPDGAPVDRFEREAPDVTPLELFRKLRKRRKKAQHAPAVASPPADR